MYARALSDKAKYISQKNGVSTNLVINHYFFDAILKRLSKSKYKKTFILKGGYLLAIQFGIATRTTSDLDILVNEIEFKKDQISETIEEILGVEIDDLIEFKINAIEDIKDGYGVRYRILCKLENIRQYVNIDICYGDPVTPKVLKKSYTSIVDNERINLNVYPFETILAEKLQTVISLGIASSRSKDLFDLYIIKKLELNKLNQDSVKYAVEKTFKHRKTELDLENMMNTLNDIKNSDIQKNLWDNYAKKHYFAENINYEDLINNVIEMVYDIVK